MGGLLLSKSLEGFESLTATLAWITTAGLLEVDKSLLAQAAVVMPRTQLKQLMQRLRAIADLQGWHRLHHNTFGQPRSIACRKHAEHKPASPGVV
jgi:hypothetical protein